TMLGFEEPSNCAFAGRVLPDCKIMVSEALGCAQKLGAFWKDRTCSREALEQAMPACSSDLAARCPSLFGGANSGGSGGGDGTNGSGAHCQGAPDSCFSQFDQVSCHAAQGCTWSSDANMCSGLPTPCASYADAGACARQSGCSWVP
ncbi:MAG TPA: hypothetical protein VHM19_07290, partial [Polyangiales bacterium]|nr:hypothetical protein [Polyangiales bacterium]